MGRYSSKDTVDGTRNLDVVLFQRQNVFSWVTGIMHTLTWSRNGEVTSAIGYTLVGHQGSPTAIRLNYSTIHRQEKRSCEYEVGLTRTSCNYGGSRYWFICPAWKDGRVCGRRSRFLYLPHGADYFACRICYCLAYASSQRSGSRFYELIERPMNIMQKASEQFDRSRSVEQRSRALLKMEWAQQMLSEA